MRWCNLLWSLPSTWWSWNSNPALEGGREWGMHPNLGLSLFYSYQLGRGEEFLTFEMTSARERRGPLSQGTLSLGGSIFSTFWTTLGRKTMAGGKPWGRPVPSDFNKEGCCLPSLFRCQQLHPHLRDNFLKYIFHLELTYNIVSFRCITWWLDTYIPCREITLMVLVPIWPHAKLSQGYWPYSLCWTLQEGQF